MRGAHRPPRAAGKKQGARAPQPDPTLAQIREYFHLPVEEASERLGVNKSKLKRLCREYGISRWPQRKLQSLSALRTHLQKDARLPAAELQALLERLDQQVAQVLEDPDKPLDREFEDMRKNVYKVRYQKRKQQKLSSGSGAWVGDDEDDEEEGETRGGGGQGANESDEDGTGDDDEGDHDPATVLGAEDEVGSRGAGQVVRRRRRVADVEASGASDDPAPGSPEGAAAAAAPGPAGGERVRRGHRVVQQPLAAPFRQRRRRRGFAGHRGRRGRRRLLTGRSRTAEEDEDSNDDEGEVSEGGGGPSRDAGRSQVHSRSSSRNSNSESEGQGGGPSRARSKASSGARAGASGGGGQHHGRRGSAGSTAEGGPDAGRRIRLRMRTIGAIAGSRRRLSSAGGSEGNQGQPLPTQLPRQHQQQALLGGPDPLQQHSYMREAAAGEGPTQDPIDHVYGGNFARTGLPLHPHTPRTAATDPPTAVGQRRAPASEPPPSAVAGFGPILHGLPPRNTSSAFELGMPYAGGSAVQSAGGGGAAAGGVVGPSEWDAMMLDLLDGGGDGSQARVAQGTGQEGLQRHFSEPLGGTIGPPRAPAASLPLSPPGQQQSHSQPVSHPSHQQGLPGPSQRTHPHQQVQQQQSSTYLEAAWGPPDGSMRLAASYRSEPNAWLQSGTQERVPPQLQQSQQQHQQRLLLQLQQQSQHQRPPSLQWSLYPRPSSAASHVPSRLAAQSLEEAQAQELQPMHFPYPYAAGPQLQHPGGSLPLSPPPHQYAVGSRQERHRGPSWPSVAPPPPVPFVWRSSSGGSAAITTPVVVTTGRPEGEPPSNLGSTALWHHTDDPNVPYQIPQLPQAGAPHILRHAGPSPSAAALQPPALQHPSQLLPTARPTALAIRPQNMDESRGPHAAPATTRGSSSTSPQGGDGTTARASHAAVAAASSVSHMYKSSGAAPAVGFPTGAAPGPDQAVPQRRPGASADLNAAALDVNVPAPTASVSVSAAPRATPPSGGVQLMDSRGAVVGLSPPQTPFQVQQQQAQSFYPPPPQAYTPHLGLGLHPLPAAQQQPQHSIVVMPRGAHTGSVARTPGGGAFGGPMATTAGSAAMAPTASPASQYEPSLPGGPGPGGPADTPGHPSIGPPASLQLLPYGRSGQPVSLVARPLRPPSQQQQDELARVRVQARSEQRRQQLATYRLEDVLPPPPQQRLVQGRSGPPYGHVPALPYHEPLWSSAGSGGLPAAPYGFIIPGRRAYSTSSDPRFTFPPGALGLMGPGGPTIGPGGRLQLSSPIHPIPLPPPHLQPQLLLPPPPLQPPSHPPLPWDDQLQNLHHDMLKRRHMQQTQLSARERALLGLGGLAPPRPQVLHLGNPWPQTAHVPQSQSAYQQVPQPGPSARPPLQSPPRHRQLAQSHESLQQQQHLEHVHQRQQLQFQRRVSGLPEWKAASAAAGSGSEEISLPRQEPPSSAAYTADPRGEEDAGAVWVYESEPPVLLTYASPYSGAVASTPAAAAPDPANVRMEAPPGLAEFHPPEAMQPQLLGQDRRLKPVAQQQERQLQSQATSTFPAVAGTSASMLQVLPGGEGGDAAASGSSNPAITRFNGGASTSAAVPGDVGVQGSESVLENQELPAQGSTADPDAVLRLMAQQMSSGGGGGFVSDEAAEDAIADLLTRSPPGSPGDLLRQLGEGD